jgi:hypothetical protein
MTVIESEPVLDDFDLDIQIDDPPDRKYDHYLTNRRTCTLTRCKSCTECCVTHFCVTVRGSGCSIRACQ